MLLAVAQSRRLPSALSYPTRPISWIFSGILQLPPWVRMSYLPLNLTIYGHTWVLEGISGEFHEMGLLGWAHIEAGEGEGEGEAAGEEVWSWVTTISCARSLLNLSFFVGSNCDGERICLHVPKWKELSFRSSVIHHRDINLLPYWHKKCFHGPHYIFSWSLKMNQRSR